MGDERTYNLDQTKVLIDIFKHCSTLSSGGVVVSATVAEKLYPGSDLRWMTIVAALVFLLSVFGGVVCMLLLSQRLPGSKPPEPDDHKFLINTTVFTLMTFIAGVSLLSVFILLNMGK